MYIYLSVQRHPLLREVHKLMSTTLNDDGLVPWPGASLCVTEDARRLYLFGGRGACGLMNDVVSGEISLQCKAGPNKRTLLQQAYLHRQTWQMAISSRAAGLAGSRQDAVVNSESSRCPARATRGRACSHRRWALHAGCWWCRDGSSTQHSTRSNGCCGG
jgi:hypothetical protein